MASLGASAQCSSGLSLRVRGAAPGRRLPPGPGAVHVHTARRQAVPFSASSLETDSATSAATKACPGCGKDSVMGGCNGQGRIQGGLGAVPGFGWWPIKAYRPCPAFLAAGGKYKRQGQSLDEVAFGRKGLEDDLLITERLQKLADSDVKERLKKLKEEEEKEESSSS